MTDIAALLPEDFEPLVGKPLTLSVDGGDFTLMLDNIKRMSAGTKRDNHIEIDGKVLPPRQAFALTLEGPREPVLSPQAYEFDLPGLGKAALFMSPFRQDHDCTLYEVLFG